MVGSRQRKDGFPRHGGGMTIPGGFAVKGRLSTYAAHRIRIMRAEKQIDWQPIRLLFTAFEN